MAVAALEDDVALARTFLLQMIARADAGEARADDENVEMFRCHDVLPGWPRQPFMICIDFRYVDARNKSGHHEIIRSAGRDALRLNTGSDPP